MHEKKEKIKVIKEARKRTALNQIQFSRLLSCSDKTVMRYETGRHLISKAYFEKCMNILLTPMSELSSLLEAFHQPQVYFNQNNSLILKLPSAS